MSLLNTNLQYVNFTFVNVIRKHHYMEENLVTSQISHVPGNALFQFLCFTI